MSEIIIQTEHIYKEFPGVIALSDISLSIKKDEIHCIVGENGAGKSTLMKILSGVYPYGTYKGKFILKGKEQKFSHIRDSEDANIAIIYQELALVPEMSVYENIFLGREQIKTSIIIDWNQAILKSKKILEEVGLDVDPATKVNKLGVGQQQLIEIAKALSKDIDVLILDEPTAALNEIESENLLQIIKKLQTNGITSILISHKLDEVLSVGDAITILRDGKTVASFEHTHQKPVAKQDIITQMIGRELSQQFPPRSPKIGEIILEVKDWCVHHPNNTELSVISNANIKIHRGEIVGLAGLMGAGRTEFAMSIFGKSYGSHITGNISFKNRDVTYKTPLDAIKDGLAYLTEDRKEKGLVLIQDIKKNITLAHLKHLSSIFGLNIDANKEIQLAEQYRKDLNIRTPNVAQIVKNLSGGNQQKVVLSKWLLCQPDLLILDEPTRGIDVGAKFEIYSLINEIATQGKSILMISSELPEILGMCDRVYVMHEGKIAGEVSHKDASQEIIMKYAIGEHS